MMLATRKLDDAVPAILGRMGTVLCVLGPDDPQPQIATPASTAVSRGNGAMRLATSFILRRMPERRLNTAWLIQWLLTCDRSQITALGVGSLGYDAAR